MSNFDVQKALGLSRAIAQPKVNYLVPWLPQFVCAEGPQLDQSTGAAISNLKVDGSSDYVLVRDEVVFAKTFNLIYGLNSSDGAVSNFHLLLLL